MQNLPGTFAIRVGNEYSYRLYTNKLYNNINILTPVQNHLIENKYTFPITRNNNRVSLRKWYGVEITECDWTYTGIEFSVRNINSGDRFRVPLVFFIVNMPTLLPIESEILTNMGGETRSISSASLYTPALTYLYDPFAGPPAPARAPAPAPARAPASDGSLSAMVSYPAHIKRIIIEDAIRKKETCAISCDEITQENAGVTSCGHVFLKESVARWLEQRSSERRCPICKQKCQLT